MPKKTYIIIDLDIFLYFFFESYFRVNRHRSREDHLEREENVVQFRGQ